MQQVSARTRGIVAGVAVFVFGFGTLCALWYLGTWSQNGPGFWDYRSATIGDGILLPVAIGLLAAAGSPSVRTSRQRWLVFGASALGLIVGATIQLAWLLDPNAPLNWGVPSPGKPNLAGAYHALFFVLVSGVFAGLAVRLVLRLNELRRTRPAELNRRLQSPAASVFIACSLGYVGLVILDGHTLAGYGGTLTSVSATVAAITAILLVVIALLICIGTAAARRAWKALLWGIVFAASLIVASWEPGQLIAALDADELAFIICFCALFAFQLWVWREFPFWWLAALALSLIAITGARYALVNVTHNVVVAAGAAAAVLVLSRVLLIAPTVNDRLHRHILSTSSAEDEIATVLAISFIWPLSFIMLARWLDGGGIRSWDENSTSGALGLALGVMAFLGWMRYYILYKQDKRSGPGEKSDENAWVAYTTILVTFYSTIWACLAVVRSSRPIVTIDVKNSVEIAGIWQVAIAACLSIILAGCGARIAKPTPTGQGHAPSFENVRVGLGLPVAGLAATALILWAGVPWVVLIINRTNLLQTIIFPNIFVELVFIIFAVLTCAWIGYTSLDSIHANIAVIELLKLQPDAWVVATLAAIATASTTLWLFVEAFFLTSGPARIDSLVFATSIVAIGNLTVLSVTALVFARSWPQQNGSFSFMALHHPTVHVANDHLLQTAFLFFAIAFSYVSWRWIDWLSSPRTTADWLGKLAAIVLPFTVVFAFVGGLTKGTKQHLSDERARFAPLVRNIKAKAIMERAGPNNLAGAISLNDRRLDRIEKRINRIQLVSKVVTLYIPYVPALLVRILKRFIPSAEDSV